MGLLLFQVRCFSVALRTCDLCAASSTASQTMLRVIYNEYKGYCLPRGRNDAEEDDIEEEIETNGFDHFDWSTDGGSGDTRASKNYYDAYADDSSDTPEIEEMYKDESTVALNHSTELMDSGIGDKHLMSRSTPQNGKKPKKGKLTKKEAKQMKRQAKTKGKKDKRSGANDLDRDQPSDPSKVKQLNNLYKQILAQVSTKPVKDNVKVMQFFDVSIYKEDLDNLKDDEWLSDNNISFLYEYLERYQLLKHDKLVSQAIQLVRPSMVYLMANIPSPADLKGVIPPLENAKFLFLPVNDGDELETAGVGSHWSLVVISMLGQTAFIYDSMERANEEEAKAVVKKVEEYLGNNTHFQIKIMDTPQQVNGSDCGIMVSQISAFLLSRLLKLEHLRDHYVNFDLRKVKISAIDGRIFSMGTILNVLKHKQQQLSN